MYSNQDPKMKRLEAQQAPQVGKTLPANPTHQVREDYIEKNIRLSNYQLTNTRYHVFVPSYVSSSAPSPEKDKQKEDKLGFVQK